MWIVVSLEHVLIGTVGAQVLAGALSPTEAVLRNETANDIPALFVLAGIGGSTSHPTKHPPHSQNHECHNGMPPPILRATPVAGSTNPAILHDCIYIHPRNQRLFVQSFLTSQLREVARAFDSYRVILSFCFGVSYYCTSVSNENSMVVLWKRARRPISILTMGSHGVIPERIP